MWEQLSTTSRLWLPPPVVVPPTLVGALLQEAAGSMQIAQSQGQRAKADAYTPETQHRQRNQQVSKTRH